MSYDAAAPLDSAAADSKPKVPTGRAASKILSEARERFDHVNVVDKENKDAAKEDTSFVYVAGAQWPKEIKERRKKRPVLEFPQLKQFINQVVNDQRQNRPGIRIHPAGTDSSKETAELLQGLIRGIEYASNAEAAYDTGFQHAVVGGRGYWRIASKYERADSFDQVLCIQRIADPQTVDLDPDYTEPDGSDRNWGFVSERVKKGDFKSRWPGKSALSWDPGIAPRWYSADDEVVVADYYRRVCKTTEVILLSDGSKVFKEDVKAGEIFPPPGLSVMDSRETERYSIEWYKIAGGEQILEQYEWPGTMIPVIACAGDEVIVDGKRMFYGLIRQARDAQRMYNYKKTAEAERYALAPKAPFIAPAEAIAGFEKLWETANEENLSVLPYHQWDDQMREIRPPTRTPPVPMEAAFAQSAQMDKQDMRSVIGMYENSLGLHGQETSGRAILAREKQGDNSTFHFVDNLSRAIALTGRILVELIPHYYDTKRLVTTVGIDDTRRQQVINQPVPGAPDPKTGAIQAIVQNDVTTGQYAVTVEAGPSYATKRQEKVDAMQQLVQSYPPLMQIAGDVIVGAMDFPDADELAERMKATLPPPIQQMLQAKEQGQDPQVAQMAQQLQQVQQQAQQALQGMQGQLQQTMQENEALKQQMQAKQAESAAKVQTETMKADTASLEAKVDLILGMFDLIKAAIPPQQAALDAQVVAPAAAQIAQ